MPELPCRIYNYALQFKSRSFAFLSLAFVQRGAVHKNNASRAGICVQFASHFCFLDSKVLLSLVRAYIEARTGHTSSDQLVDLEEGDRAETYHEGKEAVGK